MAETSQLFESFRFGGKLPGPELLITAGVHGDEVLPMLALREVIRRLEQDAALRQSLRGGLTLIPVVNEAAFRMGQRSGEDGVDLARACPGRSRGSPTERLAHALSRMIQRADCYVDLHSGGTDLVSEPLTGYLLHPEVEILERQRSMGRAFNLPFIWGASAGFEGRTLAVARDARVPAIYVEYGGSAAEWREIAEGAVSRRDSEHPCVAGCFHLLAHLGMLDRAMPASRVEEIVEDRRTAQERAPLCHLAPVSGVFRPLVGLGARIGQGDRLGEILAPGWNQTQAVLAARSGRVVVLRGRPSVTAGEPVAVVAEPWP